LRTCARRTRSALSASGMTYGTNSKSPPAFYLQG
jgi:hypothetical protein